MPRGNNGFEVFTRLTSMTKYILQATTPFDQNSNASAAAGASVISVPATTNATNGDPLFIVGSGGFELNAVNGAPATSMPLKYKLAFAQASGARVVEAAAIDLGHLDESGVTFGGSLELTPVNASTSTVPLAYIRGQGELTAQFNVRGFNNLNLQTVFGIDEGETGAGTSADPYQAGFSGSTIGTHGLQAYRLVGVLADARTAQLDFCGATVQVNASMQLGAGSGAALGVTIKYTNLVSRIWT